MNEPKLYSKHNSLQTADNVYVIENFLGLVQWHEDDRTALDVGCGEGYTTSQILLPKLPETLTSLVGCDISDEMVKFARNSCTNPRLNFCQLDVEDETSCQKLGAGFDHVFSFYCLHWISNQKKAFGNIFGVLNPGGDMLISLLGTNPIFEVYENISKNVRWAPYFRSEMVSPYHNCDHPETVIRNMLEEAGFVNCKCIVEDRKFVFENWSQLKKSVIAVNPTLPQLSASDQVEYLRDFTEEVRNIYRHNLKLSENNNEEKIPVDYKLIVVYARKPHED